MHDFIKIIGVMICDHFDLDHRFFHLFIQTSSLINAKEIDLRVDPDEFSTTINQLKKIYEVMDGFISYVYNILKEDSTSPLFNTGKSLVNIMNIITGDATILA